MGKKYECIGCHASYPLRELHIDPNTSDWWCDPCFQARTESWSEVSDREEEERLGGDDEDKDFV